MMDGRPAEKGKAVSKGNGNLANDVRCNWGGGKKEDPSVAQLEKAFVDYGLLLQTTAEVAEALKLDRKKFIDAHNYLRRLGRIIHIKDDIYIHRQNIDHLINVLHDFFNRQDILTPRDFKGMFGVSRKDSSPLLEYLDSINFTVRVDEGRKLRRIKRDFINQGER